MLGYTTQKLIYKDYAIFKILSHKGNMTQLVNRSPGLQFYTPKSSHNNDKI